jgi:VWFA-related protein
MPNLCNEGGAMRILRTFALLVAAWPCWGQSLSPGMPVAAAPGSAATPEGKNASSQSNLDVPTFRARTSVVVVPTLVLGKKDGGVVYGLKPSDFFVLDNGVRQRVEVNDEVDSRPVSLVVCVERGRDAPLEFGKVGRLGSLLSSLFGNVQGQIALVTFDSRSELTEPFTTNLDSVSKDLRGLQTGDDGAAILDAVGYSVNLLEHQPPDHRRVLLLVSESRDHGSFRFGTQQLVERIGTSNTLVLSLVFSPPKSEMISWAKDKPAGDDGFGAMSIMAPLLLTVNSMRRNAPKTLAALSGGEYASFTDDKKFEDSFLKQAGHAGNRYILSFQPTDLRPGLHSVSVQLTRDFAAQVVARNSYWVARDGGSL